MTITTATPTFVQLPGNSSATVFAFPFKIFQVTDLVVGFIVGGLYTQQSTGYSVTGVGNNAGGSVVFTTAPPTGTTVDIRSVTPQTQSTEFANLGAYLPENSTGVADRLTRLVQDLYRLTYLFGFHGPDQESIPWTALPSATARANTVVGFDADGMPNINVPLQSFLTQPTFDALLSSTSEFAADSVLGISTPYKQTAAEIAAGVTPTSYAYGPGDVRRYGGDPIGIADSTTALLAMIAQHQAGGAVPTLCAGTFLCNQALTFAYQGWKLVGTSWDTCQIKFTSALASGIVINASYGTLRDIYINGNGKLNYGITCWKAEECDIYNCSAQNCLLDGLTFNTNYSTPTGFNDFCTVNKGLYNTNGRCGISIPAKQNDNNGIQLINVNASGNASHGILLKGLGNQVIGGNIESNGGYGIMISDNTDAGNFTQNCLVWFPWVESNAMGGVHGGGNSLNNIIMLGSQTQGYTLTGSSNDMFLAASNNSGPQINFGDGTDFISLLLSNTAGGAPRAAVVIPGGSDPSIPLKIAGVGVGGLQLAPFTGNYLGFYSATPIQQPTYGISAATFVANAGTTVNTSSTFDGYTLAQVVKALRSIGLLA